MSSLIYKKYNINHKVNDLNITYKNRFALISMIDALQGEYEGVLYLPIEVYNNFEKELKNDSMAVYRSQNEIILKNCNMAIKKLK